jgi:hypothetical protein
LAGYKGGGVGEGSISPYYSGYCGDVLVEVMLKLCDLFLSLERIASSGRVMPYCGERVWLTRL